MSDDADRLDRAASELYTLAAVAVEGVRVLREHLSAVVEQGELGWKGPEASRFMQAANDRVGRMNRQSDNIHGLADAMRSRARWLREEEERQRREAALRAAAKR